QDITINAGDTANFTATATDPDGITTFQWDFNFDSESFDPDGSASQSTASHQYGEAGIYTAMVRVTDAAGLDAEATITVTVEDVAPLAAVTYSGPITEGSSVTFSVNNITEPDQADTVSIWADWGEGEDAFELITSQEW